MVSLVSVVSMGLWVLRFNMVFMGFFCSVSSEGFKGSKDSEGSESSEVSKGSGGSKSSECSEGTEGSEHSKGSVSSVSSVISVKFNDCFSLFWYVNSMTNQIFWNMVDKWLMPFTHGKKD